MLHIAMFLINHHHHYYHNNWFSPPKGSTHNSFFSGSSSKGTGYGLGVLLLIGIALFIANKLGFFRGEE